ncbi:MAG: BrnA antitoxin family protein [Thermomicrobiales bacterium]|nr:BrnA antitoxin family protein [Thermomicrobiales bacterium]
MTEEELEASIDHEDEGEFDWSTILVELPRPKVAFTMRYDQDVLEWFRGQGPGYQTKINAVLKSYIAAQPK